ncbi:hypothetical protein DY000_02058645 [Brassica cretica]|uniref:Uncharacterized protein n=1 Tax=Brassica cretica TaxID=69181 RepID=A0ABQ7AXB3_BRACR|nr:hypothetical protein DY000_02058645 [Brassica cretica]
MKRGFLGSLKKEPAGSSKIRKSTREVSIDTLQTTAIDSVNHKSIDINTTPSIDTTCEKVEKVKILILSRDKNGVLRDEEDREITMGDFLDLEEFLELGDGEKLEDWDINKEITMEDFLEL